MKEKEKKKQRKKSRKKDNSKEKIGHIIEVATEAIIEVDIEEEVDIEDIMVDTEVERKDHKRRVLHLSRSSEEVRAEAEVVTIITIEEDSTTVHITDMRKVKEMPFIGTSHITKSQQIMRNLKIL